EVQRGQALLEPGLEPPPGGCRDDPWDDVEREDLLGPLLVRIDGEGDSVVAEQLEREAVAALQLRGAEAVEGVVQPPVTWSWLPDCRKHLVVEAVELVAMIDGIRVAHGYSFCAIRSSGAVTNLRVGCEFKYDVAAPTTATVQVRPRSDSTHQLVTESWSTQPPVAVDEYADIYGNPVKRLVMAPGPQQPSALCVRLPAGPVCPARTRPDGLCGVDGGVARRSLVDVRPPQQRSPCWSGPDRTRA